VIAEAAARTVREFTWRFDNAVPENWRGTATEMHAISLFMRESGWSLTWTPPESVLRRLMATPDLEQRRRVLEEAEPVVLHDLDRLLRTIARAGLLTQVTAAREALETYRAGHFWACQALCAAALTTALHDLFNHKRLTDAREEFERQHPDDATLFDLRAGAVRGAVWRALAKHWPGDPIPEDYNRHASTHSVDPHQFTPFNSLVSLMLLVSVILEVDTMRRLAERDRSRTGEGIRLSRFMPS
jgi:hypothetical protein